eukprot:TRINITY_DN9218_c0_g1_i2.p1 TRINITY_DN9218_c0_g1~~TRINITY_DN9218_c0_g1_i2.p1  ORF type:complete len:927 (+),score=158.88 TRINITY_DN9218_c0_g1_i2:200-2980(+)
MAWVLPLLGLAYGAVTPIALAPKELPPGCAYSVLKMGTCDTMSLVIISDGETCLRAATDLGVTPSKAPDLEDSANIDPNFPVPHGCYIWHTDNSHLFLNSGTIHLKDCDPVDHWCVCMTPQCVEPPVAPPVEPPRNPPITPPVEPPQNPPVEPPQAPPVLPPQTPPVTPPVLPPQTPPVTPPVLPPQTPPVTPPVLPPQTPPITPPVLPPVTPPAEPPILPPVLPPVEPPANLTAPVQPQPTVATPIQADTPQHPPALPPQLVPDGGAPVADTNTPISTGVLQWSYMGVLHSDDIGDSGIEIKLELSAGSFDRNMWKGDEATTNLFSFGTNNQKLKNGMQWAIDNQKISIDVLSFSERAVAFKVMINGYRADMEETVTIRVSDDALWYTRVVDMGEAVIVVEAEKIKSLVGENVVGVAAVLGGAPQGAQQIALLLDLECGNGTVQKLPRSMNPLGLPIDGSDCLGAASYNTLIMMSAFGLQYLASLLVKRVTAKVPTLGPSHWLPVTTTSAAQGLIRFPGGSLFVFLFLYQGQAKCGWALIFSGAALHVTVGLFIVGALILVPGYVGYILYDAVKTEQARYREVDVPTSRWMTFIVGKGEWVSRRRTNPVTFRFSLQLRAFREACCWYLANDFGLMFLVGLGTAIPASTYQQCGHIRVFLSVLCLLSCLVEAWKRPHIRMRDNWADGVRLLLQSVGLLCAAVAYYAEDVTHNAMGLAAIFFLGALVTLLIKVLLDMATELYVLCKGRRTRLQKLEWEEYDKRLLMDDDECELEIGEMLPVMKCESRDVESKDIDSDEEVVEVRKMPPSRRKRTWSALMADVSSTVLPGSTNNTNGDLSSLELECPLLLEKKSTATLTNLSWAELKDDVRTCSIPSQHLSPKVSDTPDAGLVLPASPSNPDSQSTPPVSPRHRRRKPVNKNTIAIAV